MVLCEFNAYTCGISIALAIHSFDPLGLWSVVSSRFYKPAGSLSHSLSTRLIPSGAKRLTQSRNRNLVFAPTSMRVYNGKLDK